MKRLRCTGCLRTWSYLPPFIVYLKRYAAKVIQGCWKSWASGKSYEATAEAWHVSVQTVKRWLAPVTRRTCPLAGELRRLAGVEVEALRGLAEPSDTLVTFSSTCPGKANNPQRLAAEMLLTLTLHLLDHLTLDSADRFRVPYHFILKAAANL